MNENSKNSEEIVEELMDEVEIESPKVLEDIVAIKKPKKHIQAQGLVEETKNIVQGCDTQAESCKLLFESDLHEYENAQESLKKGGLEDCISVLEQLGYANFVSHKTEEEKVLVFERPKEITHFEIKHLQSGRFTGLFYGVLAAIIFAIALIYLATEKLGLTLDITHLPSLDIVATIASWFSVALGFEKNLYLGAAIFILAIFSMILLVYIIRVTIRSNYNLAFAQEQLEEAQLYRTAQGLCKWEMGKVEEHMRNTLSTLKLYEVIFSEQKMKLERILYIEGAKIEEKEYHSKSLTEIKETKNLIEVIQDFMSIPMSHEGKLSEQSVRYLEEAKLSMNQVLKRFYA
jgi:hypothetical protein